MFAHLLDYMVGALTWGGCGEAHMPQHPWGRAAVKGYAPTSIVDLLRADAWPPTVQPISRRLANCGHWADAPPARTLLDCGKVLRSGEALTLQQRAVRWPAPNRASGGLLIAAALRRPGPRQQLVKLLHGPAVDELCEDVGQIGLR